MQSIVITGTNRGIGLALTRWYLARGAIVFATCREPARAQKLQQLREHHGQQLVILELDVTNEIHMHDAFHQVTERGARVDLLINNAGVHPSAEHLSEVTQQTFHHTFAVNALAPLRLIHTFLPLLEQSPRARIVNFTAPIHTLAGVSPSRNPMLLFLASRYALNALTKWVAAELGAKGIITVAVWPGYIRSDANGWAAEATPADKAIPVVIELLEQLTMDHNGHGLYPNGTTFF